MTPFSYFNPLNISHPLVVILSHWIYPMAKIYKIGPRQFSQYELVYVFRFGSDIINVHVASVQDKWCHVPHLLLSHFNGTGKRQE